MRGKGDAYRQGNLARPNPRGTNGKPNFPNPRPERECRGLRREAQRGLLCVYAMRASRKPAFHNLSLTVMHSFVRMRGIASLDCLKVCTRAKAMTDPAGPILRVSDEPRGGLFQQSCVDCHALFLRQ